MYPDIYEIDEDNETNKDNTKIYSSTIKNVEMYLTNTNTEVSILCFISVSKTNDMNVFDNDVIYEFTIKKFDEKYLICNIDIFSIDNY